MTLNSCPMFTFNERDLHRMPTPLRTHLPIKGFIAASNILDEDSGRDNEADIALLRLPAPSLRGTFAKAYSLLTKLTAQIGWDELLRTRSTVFVMEEEYRKHKAHASVDGDMTPRAPEMAEDDASTKGVRSPRPMMHINTDLAGSNREGEQLDVPQTPIPTIKISSESDHEREHAALKKMGIQANGTPDAVPSPVPEEGEEEDVQRSVAAELQAAAEITKPEHIQPADEDRKASEIDGVDNGNNTVDGAIDSPDQTDGGSSFNNKRLCERWLDNLFMSLYEVGPISFEMMLLSADPLPRSGSACVYHLASGDFSFQDAAHVIPQDRYRGGSRVEQVSFEDRAEHSYCSSGKFWENWPSDCITRKRQKMLSSAVLTPGSHQRRGSNF